MSDEINVINRSQTIFVEPASSAVSVVAGGPPGSPGPQGLPGPQGPQGIQGPAGTPGGGTATPRGVSATGIQVATPAVNSLLNLSSILSGPASWLAANTITIPVGAAGLYLIECDLAYRSDNVVGIIWEVANAAGASHSPMDMRTSISHTISTVGCRYQSSWLRQCAVGDGFQVRTRGNAMAAPGYMQVIRLSLVRLGDGFSATKDLEADEA